MQPYQRLFLYGFAIFSMFFGSGNLVFPLQIGLTAGEHWLLGFAGLFLTGILLPFLGLFVIKLHRGNYELFFAEAGPVARLILPLFTLSLLGAFGVVPRCITVAHGGIGSVLPQIPLALFSLLFCIACFIICLKDHLIISVLGKWMTPLLLASLIVLISMGILETPAFIEPSNPNIQASAVFLDGFFRGYQTMDLFAAFFFSSLIFKQIQEAMPCHTDHKTVIKAALKPSIVGAGLLAVVYLGFVFLGARYQPLIATVAPELILGTIASYLMGESASLVIGFIVIFSCLTTAVALNNIYARYLCSLFKLQENKFVWVLLATTITSFMLSLLDF